MREDPQLVSRLKAGLDPELAKVFGDVLQVSLQELSAMLWISPATLARRRREGRLTPAESERLYRLAEALAASLAMVRGDREALVRWFRTPLAAFSGRTGLELLTEPLGADRVRDQVWRIVHGVYY